MARSQEPHVVTLGEFCEDLGLGKSGVSDLMAVLARRELAELSAHEARMSRCSGATIHRALPFTDEGDEVGRVEARIPMTMLFNWATRKGFGWDGVYSDEGINDMLKAAPQCRVQTVSGKTSVGWLPAARKFTKKYHFET